MYIKKERNYLFRSFKLSGYQDSNLGPPAPKAGALTGLRYTPKASFLKSVAKIEVIFISTKLFSTFFSLFCRFKRKFFFPHIFI